MLFMIILHANDTRGLSSTLSHYSKRYLMSGVIGYVVGNLIYKVKEPY